MPREAKLFSSSSGSVVRGFLKYRANIPPRWIRNARASRKRIEPEIFQSLGSLKRLRKTRPRAQVAIKNASKEMRAVLNRWEMAYKKENFCRGIRSHVSLFHAIIQRTICTHGHNLVIVFKSRPVDLLSLDHANLTPTSYWFKGIASRWDSFRAGDNTSGKWTSASAVPVLR